jgi:hypothetical protein
MEIYVISVALPEWDVSKRILKKGASRHHSQIIPRHYYLASSILFALTHSWESWMYLVVCTAQGNALSLVFSIEFSIFSSA